MGGRFRLTLNEIDVVRPDEALHRFLMNTPKKLEVAKRDIRLSGAMIDVDGRRIDWTFSVGSSLATAETP